MSKDYLGSEFKKLGFGFMRLPSAPEGEERIYDLEQTKKMVDIYMEKGFTYFDTAYVYLNGTSEVAIKEALVERYPRDSFQVASKLPIWAVMDGKDREELFVESLTRAGIDYYDFYLLHAMNKERADFCDEAGLFDYMVQLKAEGRAKHIGFSFHDKADVLDEMLTKHPEMEFVQLQINYIDWDSNDVQSKLCYEVAMKHGKPVIVMEPVKGGTLASVTTEAEKLMKDYNKDASPASWAIRYVASLDNIVTVLSGMSNLEQLEDNVSYMENFEPLNDTEQGIVSKVVDVINSIPTIPCTDCKYCVEGCPQQINIPGLFKVMNKHKKFGTGTDVSGTKNQFANTVKDSGKPSECIGCGLCEGSCPQHIGIIAELADMVDLYEA